MRDQHRILRKTKKVISPGKKPGETRYEYQQRYMEWWLKNNVDPNLLALANSLQDKPKEGPDHGSLVEYH